MNFSLPFSQQSLISGASTLGLTGNPMVDKQLHEQNIGTMIDGAKKGMEIQKLGAQLSQAQQADDLANTYVKKGYDNAKSYI